MNHEEDYPEEAEDTIEFLVCPHDAPAHFESAPADAILKALQQAVEGYIEILPIADEKERPTGKIAVFNEEGLMRGLPFNIHVPALVGTVVIMDAEDLD